MSNVLPVDAPQTVGGATARIYSATHPHVDILRMMMLLEASGKGAYEDLARAAKNPVVAHFLNCNAREELAHAFRVGKAIKVITGVEYEIPGLEQNPYYVRRDVDALTAELLRSMAKSELGGAALYECWAGNTVNPVAAGLFRQNSAEERGHCARLERAANILTQI